jgi:hypothetical protein
MLTARRAIAAALLIYCAAVFVLTLWPLDTVTGVEVFVAVLAVLAGIGMAARLLGLALPGDRYAYLVVGWAGATALGCYLVASAEADYVETRTALFMLAGALAGYGAYLSQEGM